MLWLKNQKSIIANLGKRERAILNLKPNLSKSKQAGTGNPESQASLGKRERAILLLRHNLGQSTQAGTSNPAAQAQFWHL